MSLAEITPETIQPSVNKRGEVIELRRRSTLGGEAIVRASIPVALFEVDDYPGLIDEAVIDALDGRGID